LKYTYGLFNSEKEKSIYEVTKKRINCFSGQFKWIEFLLSKNQKNGGFFLDFFTIHHGASFAACCHLRTGNNESTY